MPGVAIKAGTSTLLKLGVGFSRLDDRFTLDGVQRQGLTKYNRLNTEKYPEISLGLEPVNNALIDNGVTPAQSLTQSVFLKSGLEYKPATDISLFASLEASGSIMSDIYRAYNLDTRSVWSETVTSQGLVWNIMPAAGIAIKAGKNLTWVINLKGTTIDGGFALNDETAPFDDFGGRTTLNGARDLSASTPFAFEVAMSFLFSK